MSARRTLLVTLLTTLLAAGWANRASAQTKPSSTAEALNRMWSRGQAAGTGPVRLANFPLRVADISHINPMGMMASGHTTPTDHLYLVAKEPKEKLHDVLAVADGFIVSLQWRPNPPGGQAQFDPTVFDRAVDLKVVTEHSANVWSYLDHLVEVAEFIRTEAGERLKPGQPVSVRIPVKAGQVIGKVRGGFTFDFALIDTRVTRKGFVRPEQFLQRDPWKPHTVDPFDYMDKPLRAQLLVLNPRKVAPLGGKIDHDMPGKLAGNWYREGTGGYAGLNRRWDYWVGHLTFAYHHIAPSEIILSIGDVDGRARQFAVRGNAPDPAKISAADGLVKYELLWGRLGSSGQRQERHDADVTQGIALAQLLPDGRLKFEVFTGKNLSEVKDFTAAARFYER